MTRTETKKQNIILTEGASGIPIIDLKANYGDAYRVKRDENDGYIIPHKWKNDLGMGDFYAYSATKLACFMTGARKFNLTKKQFPSIEVTQRGDQEIVFIFDPALLPRLATAFKAARKRQYSPAALEVMRQRGRELAKQGLERGGLEKRLFEGHRVGTLVCVGKS